MNARNKYKGRIILLSTFNFLFYLLILRNITYLYVSAYLFDATQLFFLLLKLSFAGFSLGLLLFNKYFRKGYYNLNSFLNCLAYLILVSGLINFIKISIHWVQYCISFFIIFIPSFLYGLAYAIIIRELGVGYHKILVYLLAGSVLAVIVYNYLAVYLPFIFVYISIFLLLKLILIKCRIRYKFSYFICAILSFIFLSQKANFGQIYHCNTGFKSFSRSLDYGKLDLEYKFTKMGPYGALDVLYIPFTNQYITFSDAISPSIISIKDRIDLVEEQAKIPYLIKDYKKSLIIGIGGGQDIVAGLYYNTEQITAIEIDDQRISLMKKEFKDYSNDLLFDKRLSVINNGGRAFLKKTNEKFDLIVVQRPWTQKITNDFLHDTSNELFTEEALDSYIDSITNDGIIYFGIPDNIENSVLPALKNRIGALRDKLLIFYPYQKEELDKYHNLSAIVIGNNDYLMKFYSAYKNNFPFLYYPSINIAKEKNKVINYLFYEDSTEQKIDRQFYGLFNKYRLDKNIVLIFGALLLLLIIFIFNNKINYAIYFYLGIGYEIICLFSIIWFSLSIFNFFKTLPLILITYYLFGSIGYLHSAWASKKIISLICLSIAMLSLYIHQNNLFLLNTKFNMLGVGMAGIFFILISYFIAFPFGYTIGNEKNINSALSIDYLGSLFSIPIIFLLPNLNYLLLTAIFIYVIISILIFIKY